MSEEEVMVKGPSEESVDHALENEWVFWYDESPGRGATQQQFESSLKQIGSFKTIQQFWQYFDQVSLIELPERCNLRMFKSGVKPTWESPENEKGGKWTIVTPRALTQEVWTEFLLTVIGEQLDGCEDLCGAVLSMRSRGDSINIWNQNGSSIDLIEQITDQIKAMDIVVNNQLPVSYTLHQGSMDYNKILQQRQQARAKKRAAKRASSRPQHHQSQQGQQGQQGTDPDAGDTGADGSDQDDDLVDEDGFQIVSAPKKKKKSPKAFQQLSQEKERRKTARKAPDWAKSEAPPVPTKRPQLASFSAFHAKGPVPSTQAGTWSRPAASPTSPSNVPTPSPAQPSASPLTPPSSSSGPAWGGAGLKPSAAPPLSIGGSKAATQAAQVPPAAALSKSEAAASGESPATAEAQTTKAEVEKKKTPAWTSKSSGIAVLTGQPVPESPQPSSTTQTADVSEFPELGKEPVKASAKSSKRQNRTEPSMSWADMDADTAPQQQEKPTQSASHPSADAKQSQDIRKGKEEDKPLTQDEEKTPCNKDEEKPPRREEDKPQRKEDDRPPRRNEDRPPRSHDDRPPRRDDDRPPRRDDDRPPRRDDDRPPRRDDDRPPRRDDDRPPRRDDDRPPRSDDYRPRRGDDAKDKDAQKKDKKIGFGGASTGGELDAVGDWRSVPRATLPPRERKPRPQNPQSNAPDSSTSPAKPAHVAATKKIPAHISSEVTPSKRYADAAASGSPAPATAPTAATAASAAIPEPAHEVAAPTAAQQAAQAQSKPVATHSAPEPKPAKPTAAEIVAGAARPVSSDTARGRGRGTDRGRGRGTVRGRGREGRGRGRGDAPPAPPKETVQPTEPVQPKESDTNEPHDQVAVAPSEEQVTQEPSALSQTHPEPTPIPQTITPVLTKAPTARQLAAKSAPEGDSERGRGRGMLHRGRGIARGLVRVRGRNLEPEVAETTVVPVLPKPRVVDKDGWEVVGKVAKQEAVAAPVPKAKTVSQVQTTSAQQAQNSLAVLSNAPGSYEPRSRKNKQSKEDELTSALQELAQLRHRDSHAPRKNRHHRVVDEAVPPTAKLTTFGVILVVLGVLALLVLVILMALFL